MYHLLWPGFVEESGQDCNDEMAARVGYEYLHTLPDHEITYAAMMKAPETKIGFRPALSTQITAGIVARNMLKSCHYTATKSMH